MNKRMHCCHVGMFLKNRNRLNYYESHSSLSKRFTTQSPNATISTIFQQIQRIRFLRVRVLQPIRRRRRSLRQDHQGRIRHDSGDVSRQLSADDHHFRQPNRLLQEVAQKVQEVHRTV